MARQEMFVDLQKLKQVIDQLEGEQIANGAPEHRPFRSRNELHKAVSATDWGQAIGLTPVVVALRIDRYSIECKTGVRSRVMTVAPVASVTSVVAPGAEPDAIPSSAAPIAPVTPPVQRKSMYRGIDLDAFVAPFIERGIDIISLSSIVTSANHSKNMNLKIQAAWHDLRDRFHIPRVGDKKKEVPSVLPLDQIRLPGSGVDESVPTLDTEYASTETNAELDPYDPNVENPAVVDADNAGWGDQPYDEPPVDAATDDAGWGDQPYDEPPVQEVLSVETLEGDQDRLLEGLVPNPPEEVYDEAQSVVDPFYDPATDEATLDQVQDAIDQIEQEGGIYTQSPDSELFPQEALDQVAAVMDETSWGDEYGAEPILDQEPYLGELPPEGESEAPTGEFYGESQDETHDEYPEVYPEREDPQALERAQEFDEWLAAGGDSAGEYQEGHVEAAPVVEDEYLPLDFDAEQQPPVYDPNSVPVQADGEDYDASMFETEETDPNETW